MKILNKLSVILLFSVLFFYTLNAKETGKAFLIDFDNYRLEGQSADGETVVPDKIGSPQFAPGYKGGATSLKKGDMLIYPITNQLDRKEGTIECRFKLLPVVQRGRGYIIVLYRDNGNRILLRLDGINNVTMFIVSNKKASSLGGRALSITIGKWHHIAYTWEKSGNSSLVRLYIDGRLLIKKKLAIKMPDLRGGKIYVGSWINRNMSLNGVVDDIRISKTNHYKKDLYPELMSASAKKSYDKDIEELRTRVFRIKQKPIRNKLKHELDAISKYYNNVKSMRRGGDFKKSFLAYNELKQSLKSFSSKVDFAKWWGDRNVNFVVIPYTCMEKINGEWDNKYAKNHQTTIEASAAGHEWQSFQILLAMNPVLDKEIINISISDLTSSGGRIAKENIKIYKVGLIKPCLEGNIYSWADPLYPVAGKIKLSKPFMIQALWVNIYVPSGIAAGEYSGEITFSNSKVKEVKIALKQLDFTLPVKPRLQTAFGFSGSLLAQFENLDKNSPQFKSLKDKYLRNMLAYKVSPKVLLRDKKWNDGDVWLLAPKVIKTRDGKWEIDFKDYERQLDILLPLGLNSIMVGNRGWVSRTAIPLNRQEPSYPFPYYDEASGTIKHRKFKSMSKEMHKYAKWIISEWYGFLKKKGIASMAYTYITDEPEKKALDNINKVGGMIHEIEPTLDNMVTIAPSMRHEHINLSCPLISILNKRSIDEARGNLWTYVCCAPPAPHANFLIPQSALENRLPFWIGQKFGTKGFLYYEHALSLWKARDVWKNPRWADMPGTEGDGFLVYPGKDGPINTIRFEYVRQGIQDVEYFLMLKDLIKELPTGSPLKKQAEKLLVIPDSLIKSSAIYNKDWKRFAERKHQVGLMIEKVLQELKKKK
jgi:glycosyl hydrolase family 123/concanavalin A-like lectin/glucanase superfamily protein